MAIQLTNPITIASLLGATGQPTYNKVACTRVIYNPKDQSITGDLEVSCTDGSHPTVRGTFEITAISVVLQVPALGINETGSLTDPQKDIMRQYVSVAQQQVESAFLALSMILGTYSAGV